MTHSNGPGDERELPESIVSAWTAQDITAEAPTLPDDLSAFTQELDAAHRKDRRSLLWLNVREVLPSLVIPVIFLLDLANSPRPWAVIVGSLIIVAVGVFLAVISIRQERIDRDWDSSVRALMARRMSQLEHGSWLMRNVGWWYFVPYGLAILLVAYGLGSNIGNRDDQVFMGVVFVGLVVMYFVNRRVGRRRYDNEIERLAPVLADFDSTA